MNCKGVLEYKDWRNFQNVIDKTKESCKNSKFNLDEQLVEVNDIGDTSAQILIDYFKDEKNKEIIHKLEHYGLKMEIEDLRRRITAIEHMARQDETLSL